MSNKFNTYNNSEDLATEYTLEKIHDELQTGITVGSITGTVDTSTNIVAIADNPISINAGNCDNGSQRVCVATDDINLAAINTATTEIATSVNLSKVDINFVSLGIGGVSVDTNQGNASTGCQRMTIADDDTNQLAINSSTASIDTKLTTENTNSTNISSEITGNIDKHNIKLRDGEGDNNTYDMRTLELFRNEDTSSNYTLISPSWAPSNIKTHFRIIDGSWNITSSNTADFHTIDFNVLMVNGDVEQRTVDVSGNNSIEITGGDFMHVLDGLVAESNPSTSILGDLYLSFDSTPTAGIPPSDEISGVMRLGFGYMTANHMVVLQAQKVYPLLLIVSNDLATTENVKFRITSRNFGSKAIVHAEFKNEGGKSQTFDLTHLAPISHPNSAAWSFYVTALSSNGDNPYITAKLSAIIT